MARSAPRNVGSTAFAETDKVSRVTPPPSRSACPSENSARTPPAHPPVRRRRDMGIGPGAIPCRTSKAGDILPSISLARSAFIPTGPPADGPRGSWHRTRWSVIRSAPKHQQHVRAGKRRRRQWTVIRQPGNHQRPQLPGVVKLRQIGHHGVDIAARRPVVRPRLRPLALNGHRTPAAKSPGHAPSAKATPADGPPDHPGAPPAPPQPCGPPPSTSPHSRPTCTPQAAIAAGHAPPPSQSPQTHTPAAPSSQPFQASQAEPASCPG